MRRKPLYVLPGSNPGLIVKGNIDINNRPSVPNPKGGTSSVFSTSFATEINGRTYEVLVPRVVNGMVVSPRVAYLHFLKTKRHLGMFDNATHANMYARKLHLQQANLAKTP